MSENNNQERISKINNFIKKFGLSVITAQKNELQKKKGTATSKLLNSINYRFKASVEKIVVEFISEDYGKYVDEGRKPGKYVPVSKLKEWTKAKGIPESAVFPINRKIFKFGIKPRPWISKPFDKNRQDFNVELINLYSKEIINDVKKTFADKK
jgi:hypothetical protein